MTKNQPRARLASPGRIPLAGALLVVVLLAAACAGGGQAPAATQAPPTAPQPQATQPAAEGPQQAETPGAVEQLDLPAGVDANGNFYRGDPNAPVKLEEWSDYQ